MVAKKWHPDRRSYSIGQVGKIFDVSREIVVRWIRAKMISTHNVPTTHYQRITAAEIERFAREYCLPINHTIHTEKVNLLCISPDSGLVASIRENLPSVAPFRVEQVTSPFRAGCVLMSGIWHSILVDSQIGRGYAREIVHSVTASWFSGQRSVAVIANEDEIAPEEFSQAGATIVLPRPVNTQSLYTHLCETVDELVCDEGKWKLRVFYS